MTTLARRTLATLTLCALLALAQGTGVAAVREASASGTAGSQDGAWLQDEPAGGTISVILRDCPYGASPPSNFEGCTNALSFYDAILTHVESGRTWTMRDNATHDGYSPWHHFFNLKPGTYRLQAVVKPSIHVIHYWYIDPAISLGATGDVYLTLEDTSYGAFHKWVEIYRTRIVP